MREDRLPRNDATGPRSESSAGPTGRRSRPSTWPMTIPLFPCHRSSPGPTLIVPAAAAGRRLSPAPSTPRRGDLVRRGIGAAARHARAAGRVVTGSPAHRPAGRRERSRCPAGEGL